MSLPPKLYKYESFNELSLRNLKKQAVYFGSPKGFNDPYDCAIAAFIKEPSSEQIQTFKNHLLNMVNAPDNLKTDLIPDSKEEFGARVKKVFGTGFLELKNQFAASIGITCFSEINDDLLMWSHYGGRYKGFCLEFDSSKEPFFKAQKVIYSDSLPEIDPIPFLLDPIDNQNRFINLFCTKSKSWEYEKEWRAIHNEAGTLFHYPAEALTGVYFGPDIELECLEIIALILKGQNENVKFFKGSRSRTSFKVEFEEANYTPHLEAKKLGLL